MTATDWSADTHGTGEYAEVNGINLYYETRGAGRRRRVARSLHGDLAGRSSVP
jgi:hypothetical protein